MSRNKKNRYTPVNKHLRSKSVLVAPINQLTRLPIIWDRDLLPEHLWLDMLFDTYVGTSAMRLYRKFVESLDSFCPAGEAVFGFISDFGLIPVEARQKYLDENRELVESAFRKPIGGIMSCYPDAPCAWLLESGAEPDKDEEVKHLSECIIRLLPGKDMHAGHLRVIPFSQVLKHRRFIVNDGRLLELLEKYPSGCTQGEQYEVQQHVRMFMNAVTQKLAHHAERNWPKYFWRRNLELVKCAPYLVSPDVGDDLPSEQVEGVREAAFNNGELVSSYLIEVAKSHRYDLYDPAKDEILLGLFSRLSRLYAMATTVPPLWAPDMAGIILRCMADTAITFAYLTKCGSGDEFAAFVAYGEGKEKLLMLHLQDQYPKKRSIDGKSSEEIANELGGGLNPELINIELAGWTKKSVREMALQSGMDEIYRLVYDPSSEHLHGTWGSILKSNLVPCAQPMHRFHKIPMPFELPLWSKMTDAFPSIYQGAVRIGVEQLGFPSAAPALERVGPVRPTSDEDS